jgi:hypothetical protein
MCVVDVEDRGGERLKLQRRLRWEIDKLKVSLADHETAMCIPVDL